MELELSSSLHAPGIVNRIIRRNDGRRQVLSVHAPSHLMRCRNALPQRLLLKDVAAV